MFVASYSLLTKLCAVLGLVPPNGGIYSAGPSVYISFS